MSDLSQQDALVALEELNCRLGAIKSQLRLWKKDLEGGIAATESYLQRIEDNVDVRPRGSGSYPRMFDEEAYAKAQGELSEMLDKLDAVTPLAPILQLAQLQVMGLTSTSKPTAAIDAEAFSLLRDTTDTIRQDLPGLGEVIPCGAGTSNALFIARALCRKAALCVAEANGAAEHSFDPGVGQFLEQLAELLLVLARRVNILSDIAEEPWPPVAS